MIWEQRSGRVGHLSVAFFVRRRARQSSGCCNSGILALQNTQYSEKSGGNTLEAHRKRFILLVRAARAARAPLPLSACQMCPSEQPGKEGKGRATLSIVMTAWDPWTVHPIYRARQYVRISACSSKPGSTGPAGGMPGMDRVNISKIRIKCQTRPPCPRSSPSRSRLP